MTTVDLLSPPDEMAVAAAAERFAEAARGRYAQALRGVYIFGSRARGDNMPFSDVDLAIVVDDAVDLSRETVRLSEEAYSLLLETGAEVQPWVFSRSDWESPESSASPGLIRSAKREGHPVWVAP
jgi:predicted nucleotidyltransferase